MVFLAAWKFWGILPGLPDADLWLLELGTEDHTGWRHRQRCKRTGCDKGKLAFQWTGVDLSGFLQQTMDFPSTGTIVWILLAGALLLLYRKNYRTLLAYLPAAGVWLTILVQPRRYTAV